MTTPDGAQLVVGDVEWLDGLGVHLPGPTCPLPAGLAGASNCVSTIGSVAGIGQKMVNQGCRTEVSVSCINTVLQGNDENINLQHNSMSCPKRKHKSDDCTNEPCDDSDAAMDHMCVDVPCCAQSDMQNTSDVTMHPMCASDQCKCHMMDSSPETYACQQLEQPSFLVLAAGVLNEPGRLFTLWWAQSRHTHKCKKE